MSKVSNGTAKYLKNWWPSTKNLRDFDEEDYLIVQANHDYPEYVNGDAGGWIENPWEVYRNWSVSIEWTPTEEEINV